MNKNLIIGLLVAIVLLGGGYYLWNKTQTGSNNQMATSTTEGGSNPSYNSSNSPTLTPTPSSAAAPAVESDPNVVTSNFTAIVTGRVTPNGAPTTYWYEYGESTALSNRTSAQSIGSGFTAIPSPGYITGLHANTLYYFRLSAKNRYGTVNGTTKSFGTNNNPAPQGTAPTTKTDTASDISRTTANLNGHVNPNGSDASYWFEYGSDANLGFITAFQSAGNGTASMPVAISLSNLNPLTKYYFRLNAQNQFGTVNGAIQSFTTKGPAAPGVPTVDTTPATSVATSSATLNGRLNPNGASTSYWFEYSEDSFLGSILGTLTASQTVSQDASTVSVSADATGLQHNTKYFYRLVGRNQYGTVRGDTVSFTTKP